jgi:hypothetical protein
MALTHCKECAKEVSSLAAACPHCGAPIAATATPVAPPTAALLPEPPDSLPRLMGAGALILLLGYCGYTCVGASKEMEEKYSAPTGEPIGAGVACQEFVSRQLKSPGSAKYPAEETAEHAHNLGDGRFAVRSYVDSQNGFGALLRTQFACYVHKNPTGLSYTLDSLQFPKQ